MLPVNLSQETIIGYHIYNYVASLLLICLQQGQAYLKGYDPNYLHDKYLAEVKKKRSRYG